VEAEMSDEVWTTRDGTRIAVGDMSEGHVRNALRMLLRKRRVRLAQMYPPFAIEDNVSESDAQDLMNDQHSEDLRNPAIFFPLLDGGVHGSNELYRKYAGSI
jgi:hypothetical protein